MSKPGYVWNRGKSVYNKAGIKVCPGGKRMFSREFRVKVLERLDSGITARGACLEFHLTMPELQRIITWRKQVKKAPERIALVAKEKNLRERLFEKAVGTVDSALDQIDEVIQKNPLLQGENGLEHLPTVVGHLRNSGQTAVKVLEGLGDFRKGGDEIPRNAPRQPLFNLPPGSHVAVRVEIQAGQASSKENRGVEKPNVLPKELSGLSQAESRGLGGSGIAGSVVEGEGQDGLGQESDRSS